MGGTRLRIFFVDTNDSLSCVSSALGSCANRTAQSQGPARTNHLLHIRKQHEFSTISDKCDLSVTFYSSQPTRLTT
jgi:hypothetical protein